MECKRPDKGVNSKEKVFSFRRKGNKLYFKNSKDNYIKLISITKDSMVLQDIDTTQKLTLVYKRLPVKSPTTWNPSQNSYRFNGNNGQAYWDFFNDSLMVEHNDEQKDYHSKKWWLQKFENYTFLVLNQIDAPHAILMDSVGIETSFATIFDTEVNIYKMEKIESDVHMSKQLIGTWKQSETDSNGRFIPKPPESLIFQFEQFEITRDTVIAGDKLNPLKAKWILSGDTKTILFPIEKSRMMRNWKIKELTNNKLVLDMPDVFLFDRPGAPRENRVIRTYKKTTGNNTSYEKP